jgi:hypothetical protein
VGIRLELVRLGLFNVLFGLVLEGLGLVQVRHGLVLMRVGLVQIVLRLIIVIISKIRASHGRISSKNAGITASRKNKL